MSRSPLARLETLAVLTVGIVAGSLLAGFDHLHVHTGHAHGLAHRHPHAGRHEHHRPHAQEPESPERREPEDRESQRDTILSFQLGAPLIPDPIAIRAVPAIGTRPCLAASQAPRPAEARSSRQTRAPPPA